MSEAAAPLLQVSGLKKYFPVGHVLWGTPRKVVHAVDDVTFDIGAGETLGLVGETGSGKSTLGRLVLNLMPPTAGTVHYRGQDVHRLERRQLASLRGRAQIVFQDPFSSFDPRMTVRAILAEGMVHTALRGRAERKRRVHELLRTVGLSAAHADGYPHQFSGGQRQRIGIARALAVDPEFIVLDEPVSALDVSVQSQILNLLVDLRAQFGLTYLFIAHDLGVVRYLCTRVAVMYLGKLVELAESTALFARPQHPYTRELLAAVPVADPSRRNRLRRVLEGDIPSPIDPPPGCRFHTRCRFAMEVCRRVEPPLRRRGARHLAACHLE
jgi:oligopeptide/dipeptide ABC transporter ATP-binding protein